MSITDRMHVTQEAKQTIPNRQSIVGAGIFIAVLVFAWYNVLPNSLGSEKNERPVTEATSPTSCFWVPTLWEYDFTKIPSKLFDCRWKSYCGGCMCYDPKLATQDEQCPETWALEDATELRPPNGSIFFLETSCRRGRGVRLSYRQACAVESAARTHPKRTIYVLVVAPGHLAGNTTTWSPGARALLAYDNVRVARLSVWRFVHGTPLQDLLVAGALSRSYFMKHHASDLLRLLVLRRFGGVYLDLDFFVTKSLDGLTNFAVAENVNTVANSVLGFSSDDFGKRIVEECIQDVSRNYQCDNWNFNGAYAVTRVLQKLCNVTDAASMIEKRCDGFKVLPPSAFFPIQWNKWKRFFNVTNANITMQEVEKGTAVHTWNTKSKHETVFLKSQQPYAQMARRFCPRIVGRAGSSF